MDIFAVFLAGFAYFALGGLWFTPLFGRQWDKAVGFERPPKWRPSAIYYIGPLLGCLIAALASAVLIELTQAHLLSIGLDVVLDGFVWIRLVSVGKYEGEGRNCNLLE